MSRLKYGQFCPVAQAAEVVGARWTPLILRELMCGSEQFGELRRGIPLITAGQLSNRLKELEDAGVVSKHPRGPGKPTHYRLTESGRALQPVIEMLGLWGHKWLDRKLSKEELDPGFLMWEVRRTVDPSRFPEIPATVGFEFSGVEADRRRFWLVCSREGVDLCLRDPGREVTLWMSGHIRHFVDVWTGKDTIEAALRGERITTEGAPTWRRSVAGWFGPSRFVMLAEQAG